MSADIKTDKGVRTFHLVDYGDQYGGLCMPDGSVASREEAIAFARWIIHGGLFGLEEERARGRASVRYGPKLPDHPSVGTPCPACGTAFVEGDYTGLAVIGVPQNGRTPAVEVHWKCFTGEEAR